MCIKDGTIIGLKSGFKKQKIISHIIITMIWITIHKIMSHIDGLVQERCNSIANALELRLSCTNPLHRYITLNMRGMDRSKYVKYY